jgi:hypothetical protein
VAWLPGESFRAKQPDTITLKQCGTLAGTPRGHVCFVDQNDISFYLEWGIGRWIEARTDLGTFVANFVPDVLAPCNLGYVKREHFKKIFPKDFF